MSFLSSAFSALTSNAMNPKSLLTGGLYAGVKSIQAALKGPPTPVIPAPPPPPQAAKKADRGEALAANMAAAAPGGAMSGNSGTFLTGAGGVEATSLNLGKNTLLGQ